MIEGLHGFVRALRGAGLTVSPAEWIDATRALAAIDLGRRDRVHSALRATLVKRRGDLAPFDRAFDDYFRGPTAGGGGGRSGRPGAGGAGAAGRGGRGGRAETPAPGRTRPAPRHPADRRSPSTARSETSAVREPFVDAEPPTRQVGPPRENPPRDRADRESKSDPDAWLRRLRAGGPPPERRIGRLRRVVLAARPPAGSPGSASDPSRTVLRGRLDAEAESAVASALPRLLARLRRRPTRRQRDARRGALYLRRLFRRNAVHGGVPFVLPRRRRKRRPPRVAVLLDVSWSVARSAAIFLMLAEALLARLPGTRLLLFVDRPVDATAELSGWLAGAVDGGARGVGSPRGSETGAARRRPGAGLSRGGVSFAGLLEGLRALQPDAPSDYGRALHALHALVATGPALGPRDWLVVLGDGRTNRFDPQPFALEALRERVGGILWLAPEPVGAWGTGDSALAAYAPFVDVLVEAADAEGLAAGVRELARATRAGASAG